MAKLQKFGHAKSEYQFFSCRKYKEPSAAEFADSAPV